MSGPGLPPVYLIGSLRNPEVPKAAAALRATGAFEVVDDWYAAGPEADDIWQAYEIARGHGYIEALGGLHAGHVFEFDKYHLDRCEGVILVLPCGKSGHMEFGYMRGQGKWGLVLLDNPDRWDVMYKFANGVHTRIEDLVSEAVRKWGRNLTAMDSTQSRLRNSSRISIGSRRGLSSLGHGELDDF